ncbi:MAG: IPExxxVDY family protein [Bacteroidota bacterium]
MSITHRISAELYYDSFELIGVHSALEDYALAYALNSNLGIYLKRAQKDLSLDVYPSFPIFEWESEITETNLVLIRNSCSREEQSVGLFMKEPSLTTHYLIEERKEVDYFLKIESEEPSTTEKLLDTINAMDHIITAYVVDIQNLKTRQNLIF